MTMDEINKKIKEIKEINIQNDIFQKSENKQLFRPFR